MLGYALALIALIAVVAKLFPRKEKPFAVPADSAFPVDGDTLKIGEQRVRLFGVDAPEMSQPGGREAQQFLLSITREHALTVKPVTKDKYGRTVARVFAGATDLSAHMASNGYALASSDFTRAYTKFERAARAQRVGLWATVGIQNPALYRS